MASERGEYRAIRTVLLDGPDFQRLGARARWVFVAMKLNFGPSGIEVHYPAALAHQLSAQTGIPADAVAEAMKELQGAGWIDMEGNVVWIIGQLEHDPSLNANDPKHRKSIERHVGGLPRLEIVERFRGAHPDWFEGPDKALPRPSEGPSKALASTEDRRPKTEDLGRGASAPETEPPAGSSKPSGSKPSGSKRRSRAELLSAWTPDDSHRETARVECVDLLGEEAKFRDHALNRREPYINLDAAFRNWLRRANEFSRPARNGSGHPATPYGDMKPEEWEGS